VVAGEGYATEAIRVLFQMASTNRQYQLFVLHDADPDGYNIARTLREETSRMPGYHVEVIDLGLRWDDAMALGLDTEAFSRKRALPEGLRLTATEQAAFEGRPQRGAPWDKHRTWICQRVELNAFTAPQLVAYIERRLQETGVRGKVVPPDPVLAREAHDLYHGTVVQRAQGVIERLLPLTAITARLAQQMTPTIPASDARQWIDEAFATDTAPPWQTPLRHKIASLVGDQIDTIEAAVRDALREAIQGGALNDPDDEEDETDA
jgi:hypothetical protein